MKIRVSYTIEVSDEFRRAHRAYYGMTGKATRHELKNHFRIFGNSIDEQILDEYREREESK